MPSDNSDYTYAEDEELVGQFLTWTGDAVAELRTIADSLEDNQPSNSEAADRIYDLSHNIKGMGSSFNFDLMTSVGTSLCRYIKHGGATISPKVIDAHVRIFEVVLANRIMGDGGEKGQALQTRLSEIIASES
ncbi:Hpt domain-containing protein [Kordiimonas gwangyangensis]|uniref:Hpt domain-containing protein n=1 Tax=Kordiimonas gwangyangensis TaxID=288022 RepID=UPI000361B57F|nr:Hpt domain-containing protein [Kordiimonas gwangyangensis]